MNFYERLKDERIQFGALFCLQVGFNDFSFFKKKTFENGIERHRGFSKEEKKYIFWLSCFHIALRTHCIIALKTIKMNVTGVIKGNITKLNFYEDTFISFRNPFGVQVRMTQFQVLVRNYYFGNSKQ